jgi:hypothetical protein
MRAIKYHRQIREERCRLLKADDVVVNLLILPPPSPLSFAVATATATFVCIIVGGHGRMLLLKRALVQKATLRVGGIWQIHSFRLK